MMSGRDQKPDRIAVVQLRAIGAGVEPVLLRIAGDAVSAGADIAAAVLFVPDRRRKFGEIDVVADKHVFQHRTVFDDLVRNDFLFRQIRLAIGIAEFPFGQVIGKAEGHVAAGAGEHVQKNAKALRAAGNVVEHHARAVLGAQHRLGGEPDIFLPAGARDIANFAEPFGERQPFAQIVVGDRGFDVAVLIHRLLRAAVKMAGGAGKCKETSAREAKPPG